MAVYDVGIFGQSSKSLSGSYYVPLTGLSAEGRGWKKTEKIFSMILFLLLLITTVYQAPTTWYWHTLSQHSEQPYEKHCTHITDQETDSQSSQLNHFSMFIYN